MKKQKDPVKKLLNSIKMEIESRKNWRERMREPLRARNLTEEEIKKLKI